ncbi:hypothetical protein C0J45_22760 [Silurus meridionalis]|uniref:Uncharacterized protein n=1 Tax=Silurus meridionalis TaxID=175797 RepID=A0A8T0A4D5_SILME|nr:hypothetical protein HF521_015710 [Silurus meridionalis]KAI5087361.1 hypothetical protein C0J45_22760 [Silurus meridionalis]
MRAQWLRHWVTAQKGVGSSPDIAKLPLLGPLSKALNPLCSRGAVSRPTLSSEEAGTCEERISLCCNVCETNKGYSILKTTSVSQLLLPDGSPVGADGAFRCLPSQPFTLSSHSRCALSIASLSASALESR